MPLNAALADRRLDGKRSRRVEALCRAHGGKGSPCDFISIHSYNRSEMMAAKLIRAKEMALEIDPDYYRALWVNSHEACPDWMPPPDEAAADAYLGNGYFATWCVDVVHRQLLQAARDPRYAFGETILTVWPPPVNFAGINAVTRVLHFDDDGDGQADRTVTVPMPIFHVLGLLSDLGDRYWVLPERIARRPCGQRLRVARRSGCRAGPALHPPRAGHSIAVGGIVRRHARPRRAGLGRARPVEEYRFDRDHNSPFRLAHAIPHRPAPSGQSEATRFAEVKKALETDDPAVQVRALESLPKLAVPTRQAALEVVFKLAGQSKDQRVRDAATAIIRSASAQSPIPPPRSRRSGRNPNVIRPACRRFNAKPTAICGSPSTSHPTAAISSSSSATACYPSVASPTADRPSSTMTSRNSSEAR